jgi:acyl-CoA thioester hydrolase
MKEFVCEVPLRWGDMDAMAHLNNVQYFRLIEEARIQWMAALGLSTFPSGEALILAHAAMDFVKAMTYPATALVRQTVTRLGRSSVEMAIIINTREEPDTVFATARTVVVWYDYTQTRSAPWPEHVRAALA